MRDVRPNSVMRPLYKQLGIVEIPQRVGAEVLLVRGD